MEISTIIEGLFMSNVILLAGSFVLMIWLAYLSDFYEEIFFHINGKKWEDRLIIFICWCIVTVTILGCLRYPLEALIKAFCKW